MFTPVLVSYISIEILGIKYDDFLPLLVLLLIAIMFMIDLRSLGKQGGIK